jgi:hypothetical protein
MSRTALISTLAFTTLASGCATADHYVNCPTSDSSGNCGRDAAISAGIGLAALGVVAGGYYLLTRPSRPERSPRPAAPERSLIGQVSWADSRAGVPAVSVSLHRREGLAGPKTITDQDGGFRLPYPLKADWYIVSVDTPAATGETTVWLQDHRPESIEVLVIPRSTKL